MGPKRNSSRPSSSRPSSSRAPPFDTTKFVSKEAEDRYTSFMGKPVLKERGIEYDPQPSSCAIFEPIRANIEGRQWESVVKQPETRMNISWVNVL